ncbi:MAG: hypothetical protein ABIN18_14410 [Pseudomonadota bacterium]
MPTDKQWEAENDARSLADAEAIQSDKSRLKKAKTAALRLAKEETEKTNALRKVAGLKAPVPKNKPIQRKSNTKAKAKFDYYKLK